MKNSKSTNYHIFNTYNVVVKLVPLVFVLNYPMNRNRDQNRNKKTQFYMYMYNNVKKQLQHHKIIQIIICCCRLVLQFQISQSSINLKAAFTTSPQEESTAGTFTME